MSYHGITPKETTKKVDLSNDVFGVEPNDHAIYLDVKQNNISYMIINSNS